MGNQKKSIKGHKKPVTNSNVRKLKKDSKVDKKVKEQSLKSKPVPKKQKKVKIVKNLEVEVEELPKELDEIEVDDLKETGEEYVFRQYFESETQLKEINFDSDPEKVLEAYSRLIWVYASNHVRDGVDIEDLISEGQKGVCEAIQAFNDPNKKRPNYNFYQACLYKIRSSIYQYCLRNANQIKTPYYIQRGRMHVAQIFKLMSNQSVAEAVLGRLGPASEADIVGFLYNENERLPLKSLAFIKKQITKHSTKEEFKQILMGILEHQLGSRHSYIKNNLTDVGKILHIKEKLWYTSFSNKMNYARVIDLILSARQSQTELDLTTYCPQHNDVEDNLERTEMIEHGRRVCGEENFNILMENKYYDKTYEEIAQAHKLRKLEVVEIIKDCIRLLRKDDVFIELFNSL